jgi:hypothetical protein
MVVHSGGVQGSYTSRLDHPMDNSDHGTMHTTVTVPVPVPEPAPAKRNVSISDAHSW